MFRSPVNSHADSGYFRRTAATTKSVNLGVRLYRGGIRF